MISAAFLSPASVASDLPATRAAFRSASVIPRVAVITASVASWSLAITDLTGAAAVNAAVIASACACVRVPFVTSPERTVATCEGTPFVRPLSACAVETDVIVPIESAAAIAAAAIFLFIFSLPLCVVATFIAFDLSQNLKWLLPDTRR